MSGIMWVLRGKGKILSLRLGVGEKLSLEDFPSGPVIKNPLYNAGDAGLILDQGTKILHVVWAIATKT